MMEWFLVNFYIYLFLAHVGTWGRQNASGIFRIHSHNVSKARRPFFRGVETNRAIIIFINWGQKTLKSQLNNKILCIDIQIQCIWSILVLYTCNTTFNRVGLKNIIEKGGKCWTKWCESGKYKWPISSRRYLSGFRLSYCLVH